MKDLRDLNVSAMKKHEIPFCAFCASSFCTAAESVRPSYLLPAIENIEIPFHPGVELRANLRSISHKCHLFEVAFVSESTKETIRLPLGCLLGGVPPSVKLIG